MKGRVLRSTAILFCGLLLGADTAHAQSGPPISGLTGTIATEGSMKAFYRGAKKIIVTTADGVDHVYEFGKDLLVHGGKHPGPDALDGLREGATVVVHSTASGSTQAAREVDIVGEEGVKVTEGTVAHLDRRHHDITVRFDNGRTETFHLTDRAAREAANDTGAAAANAAKVVIYYTDEDGRKVVHYFKKVS